MWRHGAGKRKMKSRRDFRTEWAAAYKACKKCINWVALRSLHQS